MNEFVNKTCRIFITNSRMFLFYFLVHNVSLVKNIANGGARGSSAHSRLIFQILLDSASSRLVLIYYLTTYHKSFIVLNYYIDSLSVNNPIRKSEGQEFLQVKVNCFQVVESHLSPLLFADSESSVMLNTRFCLMN